MCPQTQSVKFSAGNAIIGYYPTGCCECNANTNECDDEYADTAASRQRSSFHVIPWMIQNVRKQKCIPSTSVWYSKNSFDSSWRIQRKSSNRKQSNFPVDCSARAKRENTQNSTRSAFKRKHGNEKNVILTKSATTMSIGIDCETCGAGRTWFLFFHKAHTSMQSSRTRKIIAFGRQWAYLLSWKILTTFFASPHNALTTAAVTIRTVVAISKYLPANWRTAKWK